MDLENLLRSLNLASLHSKGHIVSSHLDDFYQQGKTQNECCSNLIDTVTLFTQLGLVVHPDKCAFCPSQELVILGFVINSVTMTVRLTSEKALALKIDCQKFLKKSPGTIVIRALAQIGKLVSSFPGVLYGPLYYRHLERDKTTALAIAHGNFDARMTLSEHSALELQWWSAHVVDAFKPISHGEPSSVITTDASLSGWGGRMSKHNHWRTVVLHGSSRAYKLFGVISYFSGFKNLC